MSFYLNEAVEKIPNKDKKDFRKQSLRITVCIAPTCQ